MNIAKFAINNYHIVCTVFCILLVASIINFNTVPRTEFPVIDVPTITVVAVISASNVEDIETHFLSPLEEAINVLGDIKEIRSTITGNVISIQIRFVHGVDMDKKLSDAKSAVNFIQKELPPELVQLNVEKASTNFTSIMNLALVPNNVPKNIVEQEAKRIQKIIRQVNGVKNVHLDAYPKQELQISIDVEKMHSHRITFNEIERILVQNNSYIPAGDLDISTKNFNVITTGAFNNVQQIRETFIKTVNGRYIQLDDIADINISFEKQKWISRHNGEESLIIHIYQNDNADVIDVSKRIKNRLTDFSFQEDIDLQYIYNQADEVDTQINSFFMNLIQGLILVCIILFVVLGFRSAAIIAIFIPLTSFIGLMLTNLWGLGLNQMTIVGMIVSLGLLVDNSIAIIENIERLLEEGLDIFNACTKGVEQLLYPMTSSTFTTMAVFIPIIFMPDTTGDFIKPMPIVVFFTMLSSLVISITLAPVFCFFYLKKYSSKPLNNFIKNLEEKYQSALSLLIDNRGKSLLAIILLFIGSMALFPQIGITFFPKADKQYFYITVQTDKGKNLNYTNNVVLNIEKTIEKTEGIKAYTSSVGHGNPSIYYNLGTVSYSNNYAEIFIETSIYNKNHFNQLVQSLREDLSKISNATINVKEYSQGLPATHPLEIIVYGDNLEKLKEYNKSIIEKMKSINGIINIDNSIDSKMINIAFDIDYKEAAMLGVRESDIEKEIKNIFYGSNIGRFTNDNNNKLNIKLNYSITEKEKIETLKSIRLRTASNQFVTLDKLVDVRLSNSINQLTHINFDRISNISADIKDDKELNRILKELRQEINVLDWAAGYTYSFKGDFENRDDSFGQLGYATIIAILIILTILIAQYKSFVLPGIIISILPLTIVGSIFALFLTGQSFSFTAFIGLISLIGICINDSIILVDFTNELFKKGVPAKDAVIQAAKIRFVPVLMTSVTTILGLFFLALNGGALWAPMAITIIGGLIGTTFFVLILIPILFIYVSPFLNTDSKIKQKLIVT